MVVVLAAVLVHVAVLVAAAHHSSGTKRHDYRPLSPQKEFYQLCLFSFAFHFYSILVLIIFLVVSV